MLLKRVGKFEFGYGKVWNDTTSTQKKKLMRLFASPEFRRREIPLSTRQII